MPMRSVAKMRAFVTAIRLFLCCMLLSILTSATGLPTYKELSQDEAFGVAQKQFSGRNVDYYLIREGYLGSPWIFFVDADPMAGWEHECYRVYVDNRIGLNTPVSEYIPNIEPMMCPPDDYMTPLYLSSPSTEKPSEDGPKPVHFEPRSHPNRIPDVNNRVWCVLISGGCSPNYNNERYWNNCSYIYQTLTKLYKVPRSNIYVIMADGTDPAPDQYITWFDPIKQKYESKLQSSPLDLDGDGRADIQYSATQENIRKVFNELYDKVQTGDHVFVFVTDHGGSDDTENGISYVWLWDKEQLYDYELSSWIDPFLEKSAIVNVVMGQCFSGGFIDDFAKPGCVIATSTTKDEVARGSLEYTTFLKNWTDAISDQRLNSITADYDDDGFIAMDEAFAYAYASEVSKDEHPDIYPMYQSTHPYIGEELAFDRMPRDVDLFIKDNYEDTGKEPNVSTDIFYDSPSIWVRNADDNIEEHENPVFDITHPKCFAYVRIHNRGRIKYEGGKYLHMYWAKASLNFSLRTWTGQETYNDIPTGGHFGGVAIPPIEAGYSVVVPIEWDMTQLLLGQFSNDNEGHHYCLLAAIKDYPGNGGYDGEGTYQDVQGLKTQAQKNLTIIYRKDLDLSKAVYVRNAIDSPKKYSLEIRPRTAADEAIYSMANIEMELSQPIYDAWVKGGTKSVNVSHNVVKPLIVRFTSPSSKIEAVSLSANQFEKVGLKFNFTKTSLRGKQYTLDLIQRDETGQIVGGEAFIVEAPLRTVLPIDIGITPYPGNQFGLTVNNPDVKSVTWYNSDGDVIGQNDSITVFPTMSDYVYAASTLTNDGELATDEISLQTRVGIESLSPASAVGDRLEVVLRTEPIVGDKLLIADVNEADCQTEILLEPGCNSTVIDTSALRTGLYAISYVSEDRVVDTKKFTKR